MYSYVHSYIHTYICRGRPAGEARMNPHKIRLTARIETVFSEPAAVREKSGRFTHAAVQKYPKIRWRDPKSAKVTQNP